MSDLSYYKHPTIEMITYMSCRIEDEEAGQIPVAYVVRTAGPGADLTEDELIQYVAKQVIT